MADINITGTFHNTEVIEDDALHSHVAVKANEVLDEAKEAKQSDINTTVANTLTAHQNAINALHDQQYVYLEANSESTEQSIFAGVTPAEDTIYRVAKWNGSAYNVATYSEYTYNGTTFVFLDAKSYGIDEVPTAGSDNLVKSGGVHDTIAEEVTIGKKYVNLYSFYGGNYKNKYLINSQGYIQQSTAAQSTPYRVVYTTVPVNKGAILHADAVLSDTSAIVRIGISDVPITDENFETIQLTMLYSKNLTQNASIDIIIPFTGYVAFYRRTTQIESLSFNVYNSSAIQDNSVLDISELNNTNYADFATAVIAVPETLQKGGMEIRYRQIIPATYTVAVTESDTEPTGTALESASSVTDGTYTADQLSDFATLPAETGAGNAQVYYYENGGTYTIWTITMATAESSEYKQYRLMTDVWSDAASNWQGVDNELTGKSKNLITSGCVKEYVDTEILKQEYTTEIDINSLSSLNYYIANTGKWSTNANGKHRNVPVAAGEHYFIKANNEKICSYAFLTSTVVSSGGNAPLVPNTSVMFINAGDSKEVVIPEGCLYLYLREAITSSGTPIYGYLPSKVLKTISFGDTYEETSKNSLIVSLVGNNNNGVYSDFIQAVKPGNPYRVWVKNPNINMSGVTYSTDSYVRFAVYSYTDIAASGTTLISVTCNDTNRLADFYDIVIPDDAVAIRVIMRATTGAEQAVIIEDFSAEIDSYDKMSWNLIPLFYTNKLALNNAHTSYTTNNTFITFYNSCVKGELLKIDFRSDEISSVNSVYLSFSENIPASSVSIAYTQRMSVGQTIYIKAPITGYVCVTRVYNVTVTVSKIEPDISTLYKHSLSSTITANRAIDCKADSETYGTPVTIDTNNWGITDFIDISGFSYIGLRVNYGISNLAFVAASGAIRGGMFYKEEEVDGVLTKVPIQGIPMVRTGSSVTQIVYIKKPSEAKYIRALHYVSNQLIVYGLDTVDSAGYDYVKSVVNETNKDNAKTTGSKTIFELNPDTEMLQKMVILNKKRNNGASGSSDIPPLVLAHMSDAHGGSAQYARYIEFAEHWKDKGYIDELIDTGDVVQSKYSDALTWRESLEGVENILTVVGNHDTRCNDSEQSSATLSGFNIWNYHSHVSIESENRNDSYNLLMVGPDSEHPYVDNWGVTQPANAAENGLCYYYKDYVSRSIRLIGIDVMGYDADQHTWLQDLLADAIINDLHVVILAHFTGTAMTPLDCNYTSLRGTGNSFTGSYSVYLEQTDRDALAEAVDAFQTAGGVFIGYIIGHYHRDMINVVTGYPKQLIFAVSSGGTTTIRDFTKVSGCKSYDDFQIIGINTYDKTVRLAKVGADLDYFMRKKGTVCVGYTLVKDDGTEPGAGETATKVKGIIGEGW